MTNHYILVERFGEHKPGSLWRCHSSDSHEDQSTVMVTELTKKSSKKVCPASSSNYENIDLEHLREVDEETLSLLEAIKQKHRLKVFDDISWVEDGKKLQPGDRVKVMHSQYKDREPDHAIGKLMYRGAVEGLAQGVWFGVELEKEFHGTGTSDGSFRKVSYFHCDRDCALFLSLDGIRALTVDRVSIVNTKAELIRNLPIKVEDRIVWLSDNGPERGTVRWLGFLPQEDETINLKDREITAGVEFDNAIGRGTGKFQNQQLFHAQRKHASLVPVLGLIKESEYFDIPEFHLSSDEDRELTTDGPSEMDSHMSCKSPMVVAKGGKIQEDSDEDCFDPSSINVGSFVVVDVDTERNGIVRWKSEQGSSKVMLGLEMEEEDPRSYTDGTFENQRFFICPPHKGFFIYLNRCRPDKELSRHFGNKSSRDIFEDMLPLREGNRLPGEYVGIQGHNNSSFLDCILTAVFINTNILYTIIKQSTVMDVKGESVRRALLGSIVNPLRASRYVRADKILQLRVLIQDACQSKRQELPDLSMPGNDPEIVLNSLFGSVFNIRGLMLLSTTDQDDGSFVCHVSLSTLPDEGHSMQGAPGISDLLQLTSFQYTMKFLKTPTVLVVKIHRRMPGEAIYVDPVLDITDIVSQSERECHVCGSPASHECRDCFSQDQPSLQQVTFCAECMETTHSRGKQSKHKPEEILSASDSGLPSSPSLGSDSVSRIKMSLFAVICLKGKKKKVPTATLR